MQSALKVAPRPELLLGPHSGTVQRRWLPAGNTVVAVLPQPPSPSGAGPSLVPQWWSLLLLSDQAVATTVVAIIGKFTATASFSTSYVYSAELFPTVAR